MAIQGHNQHVGQTLPEDHKLFALLLIDPLYSDGVYLQLSAFSYHQSKVHFHTFYLPTFFTVHTFSGVFEVFIQRQSLQFPFEYCLVV